jgi:hypothetical protein
LVKFQARKPKKRNLKFNLKNIKKPSNASTKGGKMGSKGHGIEELSEFAMGFIKQAGKKALPFYGKGQSRVKFDQGMVTEADLRIADYFQEKLNERFPDHHMFKYDELNEKYSHEGKRYLWIFDPIEGVANYQAGIPIWGMSMALLDNFWPILGVFHMPATGDIFHARAGQDAFWGKKKIRISEAPTINDESVRARCEIWDVLPPTSAMWPWGGPTRRLSPMSRFRDWRPPV